MAKERYTVREVEYSELGTGGRDRKITAYVVWDGTRGCIAHGTKGANGTGGYPNKRQAKHIANERNNTEAQMRADRDRRRRS